MPYELCRFIMTTGKRCQSPALRDQNWCFYHDRSYTRHRSNRVGRKPAKDAPLPIHLPAIDDAESIQLSVSLIVDAVARGLLDDRRAATLLRGLSIAARNVAHVNLRPDAPDVIRSYTPSLEGITYADRAMNDQSPPPERQRNLELQTPEDASIAADAVL